MRIIRDQARRWARAFGFDRTATQSREETVTAQQSPDVVSVIMPMYNASDYLREALDSLLAQTYGALEILIVDDGSTDDSVKIAEAYAQEDSRIHLLKQSHSGQGAARNYGLSQATGEFLIFMDSDDIVPPQAYSQMVAQLRASGSDFCLGAVERFTSTRTWRPPWVREVHDVARSNTTIDEFPIAIKDIIACNRMYRRQFWTSKIRTFPEGMVYEDHLPMLSSFLAGSRFDVLTEVTYRWRTRDDLSNTGKQKHRISNLTDRIRAMSDAWEALLAWEASDTVRQAWLARVIDLDLSAYYTEAVTATSEYRQTLQDTARIYWELLEPATHAFIRPRSKLSAWLVLQGDWSKLALLGSIFEDRHASAAIIDETGQLSLRSNLVADLLGSAPAASLLRYTDFETRAQARFLHTYWRTDASFHIEGILNVARLEFDRHTLSARITLAADGKDVWSDALDVTSPAPVNSGSAALEQGGALFSVDIPFGRLLSSGNVPAVLVARIELTAGNIRRETHRILTVPGGSARFRQSGSVSRDGGLVVVTPEIPAGGGLRFRNRLSVAFVSRADMEASDLVVEVQHAVTPGPFELRLRNRTSGDIALLTETVRGESLSAFEINLEDLNDAQPWLLEMRSLGENFKRAPVSYDATRLLRSRAGVWQVNDPLRGGLEVVRDGERPRITSVRIGEGVHISVFVPAHVDSLTAWTLRASDAEAPAVSYPVVHAAENELFIPTETLHRMVQNHGFGTRWAVEAEGSRQDRQVARPHPDLSQQLPFIHTSGEMTLGFSEAPEGFVITIGSE